MSSQNKMINAKMTVIQLKAAAKAQGIKGYSKLRKAELLQLVYGGPGRGANESILDSPVPDIQVPTLSPSPYVPTSVFRKIYDKTKAAIKAVVKAATKAPAKAATFAAAKAATFANWIVSLISPEPKRIVNEKRKASNTKVDTNLKKFEIRESKSAIKGFAKQYTIDGMEGIDAVSFLNSVRPQVISQISRNPMTKINIVLTCIMERVDMKSGEVITAECPFVSKTEVVLAATDVNEIYRNARDKILESMANFQRQGSNWRFKAVVKMDVNTTIYKPLKGKSYIPLPAILADKKAIINMKNEDDQCFKWCVSRALNPVDKNPDRITKELQIQAEKLNWDGIKFPRSEEHTS